MASSPPGVATTYCPSTIKQYLSRIIAEARRSQAPVSPADYTAMHSRLDALELMAAHAHGRVAELLSDDQLLRARDGMTRLDVRALCVWLRATGLRAADISNVMIQNISITPKEGRINTIAIRIVEMKNRKTRAERTEIVLRRRTTTWFDELASDLGNRLRDRQVPSHKDADALLNKRTNRFVPQALQLFPFESSRVVAKPRTERSRQEDPWAGRIDACLKAWFEAEEGRPYMTTYHFRLGYLMEARTRSNGDREWRTFSKMMERHGFPI